MAYSHDGQEKKLFDLLSPLRLFWICHDTQGFLHAKDRAPLVVFLKNNVRREPSGFCNLYKHLLGHVVFFFFWLTTSYQSYLQFDSNCKTASVMGKGRESLL